MLVKESTFLQEKKPVLKELLEALLERYDYASILATDSTAKRYSVSKTGTNISENPVLTEKGFCIKIYNRGEAAEYSFNEVSQEKIPEILKAVEEKLLTLSEAVPEGVTPYRFTDFQNSLASLARRARSDLCFSQRAIGGAAKSRQNTDTSSCASPRSVYPSLRFV